MSESIIKPLVNEADQQIMIRALAAGMTHCVVTLNDHSDPVFFRLVSVAQERFVSVDPAQLICDQDRGEKFTIRRFIDEENLPEHMK